MLGKTLARLVAALVVCASLTACVVPAAVPGHYPNRPVTVIVPSGAGGPDDATARIIGKLLENELGQPVIVIDRPGRHGAVGYTALAKAAPDGYTIGLVTAEIGVAHSLGVSKLTGASYTPLGLVSADRAGLQVRADARYATAKDLVEAIKANPGALKASGTGYGGLWHVALAGMLKSLNVDPAAVRWMPSNGTAPALEDLVDGTVDIVSCSIPEARWLINAGKVKTLAVMGTAPPSLHSNLPPPNTALDTNWTLGLWRGIAAPKGLPEDVKSRLVAAVKRVYDSKEFKDFMTSRGFGPAYLPPAEFAALMEKSEKDLGAAMKDVGIVR